MIATLSNTGSIISTTHGRTTVNNLSRLSEIFLEENILRDKIYLATKLPQWYVETRATAINFSFTA